MVGRNKMVIKVRVKPNINNKDIWYYQGKQNATDAELEVEESGISGWYYVINNGCFVAIEDCEIIN